MKARWVGDCEVQETFDLLLRHNVNVNAQAVFEGPVLAQSARTGNAEEVRKLINAGADVNARDRLGRTPVMYAALCGRLEVYKMLRQHGADVSMKDVVGKGPLELARLTQENEEERHAQNMGHESWVFSFGQDPERGEIARDLEGPEAADSPDHSRQSLTNDPEGHFASPSSPDSASPHEARIRMGPVGPTRPMAGCLLRGHPFVPLFGRSGWSHEREWVNDALELAREVGFTFPSSPDNDHGVPGAYYASHIEAKLLAQAVKRHFRGARGVWGQFPISHVWLAEATIAISHFPCSVCLDFFEALESQSVKLQYGVTWLDQVV